MQTSSFQTNSTHPVPEERFFINNLQKQIHFLINDRLIKKGRLMLFRKSNYFIQISLFNEKKHRENFEIPIPFKVECHEEDGLMYFDYRISSLEVKNLPKIPEKVISIYFDKILEIQIISI